MKEQSSCAFLIKQINDELAKRGNNALRAQDLTMAQLNALMILNESKEKKMPLKELEHKLHVAQSTAVGIVHRLEQKRFVECLGDASDRRIKVIRITAQGMECCIEAKQNMEQAENMLFAGLTGAEREGFQNLLRKVRSTLA